LYSYGVRSRTSPVSVDKTIAITNK
jgi:hypothetical protein